MTTYLTIITTVLVWTQIIRLIQNAMQLQRLKDKNDEVTDILKDIQKDTSDIYTHVYRPRDWSGR
jgi:hypothetical protein